MLGCKIQTWLFDPVSHGRAAGGAISGGLDRGCTQLQGRDRAGSWLPSPLLLATSHPNHHFSLPLENSDIFFSHSSNLVLIPSTN